MNKAEYYLITALTIILACVFVPAKPVKAGWKDTKARAAMKLEYPRYFQQKYYKIASFSTEELLKTTSQAYLGTTIPASVLKEAIPQIYANVIFAELITSHGNFVNGLTEIGPADGPGPDARYNIIITQRPVPETDYFWTVEGSMNYGHGWITFKNGNPLFVEPSKVLGDELPEDLCDCTPWIRILKLEQKLYDADTPSSVKAEEQKERSHTNFILERAKKPPISKPGLRRAYLIQNCESVFELRFHHSATDLLKGKGGVGISEEDLKKIFERFKIKSADVDIITCDVEKEDRDVLGCDGVVLIVGTVKEKMDRGYVHAHIAKIVGFKVPEKPAPGSLADDLGIILTKFIFVEDLKPDTPIKSLVAICDRGDILGYTDPKLQELRKMMEY